MKIKIYRWLDYNKWLFIATISVILLVYISCKPQHTDVQFNDQSTDTITDTLTDTLDGN